MANYVKATNFAVKDSLASGNPAKIVKGTEIDAELTAIASAIASKPDADSPTLTGTPLAPTATVATNNTQIATTAYVVNRIAQDIVAPLALKADLASPIFTGIPAAPTATLGTNTTQIATTAFVVSTSDLRALKTTTLSAGTGLTGGGDLSTNRTISIASGGVGTTQLASLAVTQDKIANSAVGTNQIANSAVTGDKIANTTITQNKLDSIGSVGSPPISAARVWVNFRGTGVINVRAGNNVSSVTDNGVGDYTVNFFYAMPEANYSVCVTSDGNRTNSQLVDRTLGIFTTSAVQINTTDASTAANVDRDFISVVVFR